MEDKEYREILFRLRQAHIEYGPRQDNGISIMLAGEEIGAMTSSGEMRIQKDFVHHVVAGDLYDRVKAITSEVMEYMHLMINASPFHAADLNEPYQKLAEFNGYVLCGKESEYGVQFATWMKDFDGTGVVFGHYFGNDYSGAKQDFAVRCGLINGENLFTPEQFAEIYRCCSESLNENFHLSWEQEQVLEKFGNRLRNWFLDGGNCSDTSPMQGCDTTSTAGAGCSSPNT